MRLSGFYITWIAVLLMSSACRQTGSGSADSAEASLSSSSTIVGLKSVTGGNLQLSQRSWRSIVEGVKCRVALGTEQLEVVPVSRQRALSASGKEYFLTLPEALDSSLCSGNENAVNFDYKSFYVRLEDVELQTSDSVVPAPVPVAPVSTDDLRSVRAEALARDMEKRRSANGTRCGLTSFGSRGCWSCVGWAMTETGNYPNGLGSLADANPNGFLRATQAARSRKGADGVVDINGKRFRSLIAQYRSTPSLAPRGSILFCNTSAAGHAAVITKPANEMRSDVIEILSDQSRQSLCWEQVQEILFPLD
ncbi:MAG: hypothetical protein RL189_1551 [Pseudomonadota bacterium]|jgi:hypothetical protein